MALARAPRTPNKSVNLSVGLLLMLLIASIVLYRFGTAAATSALADVAPPERIWRIELDADATGVATAGSHTYILTKDKLGSSALAIVNDRGLLLRMESLGTSGSFRIASTPLGVVCWARDQGAVFLYGLDGKRHWGVHLPGPVTAIAADNTGLAAAIGPQPGTTAGDTLVLVSAAGVAGQPIAFPYGAITSLARGPGRTTALSLFTADPNKPAEALVFVRSEGIVLQVTGTGMGAARLAAGDSYFVGTAKGVSAYDSCGQRRWTARLTGIKAVAAGHGLVAAAHGSSLALYSGDTGKRLWDRSLGAATKDVVADADGFIVSTAAGVVGIDLDGRPRWALSGDTTWDAAASTLVTVEEEMASAYRTR